MEGRVDHGACGRDEVAALGVARTFQNIALFPHMTVLDNLLTGRHVRMRRSWLAGMVWLGPARREELEHRGHIEDIIDFLEIERWRKHPVALGALRDPEARSSSVGRWRMHPSSSCSTSRSRA